MQRFYNDNIAQYQTPEQIRASHILLKTAGKDEATVRKQAEDILEQVKAGADFAALATKFSEDEGSKVNGGDLDYFSRGRMVPEFETAAFALQPGQISDLVKTQFGFHIIKVVDKKPAVTRTARRGAAADRGAAQGASGPTSRSPRAPPSSPAASTTRRSRHASPASSGLKVHGIRVLRARRSRCRASASRRRWRRRRSRSQDNAVSAPIASPRGPVFVTVTEKKDPYVPMLDEVKDRVREDVIRASATEIEPPARGRDRRGAAIGAAIRRRRQGAGLRGEGDRARLRASAPLPDIGVSPEVDKVAFACRSAASASRSRPATARSSSASSSATT